VDVDQLKVLGGFAQFALVDGFLEDLFS
jgi:hypothetical protein